MRNQDTELLAKVCQDCVQCGACRAVCPLHRLSRREEHAPRGKLKLYQAMLNRQMPADRRVLRALIMCLLCGRCQKNCPSKLKVTEAFKQGRAWLVKKQFLPARLLGRVLLSSSLPRLMKPAWPLKKALSRGLKLRFKPLSQLPALRVSALSFNERPGTGQRIGLFVGCMATYARPGLAEKAIDLLGQLGTVIPLAGCCGLAAQSAGEIGQLRKAAQNFYNTCQQKNLDQVVTICTSCAHALSQEHVKHLPANAKLPPVVDISQLLAENVSLVAGKAEGMEAYLHLSCHLEADQAQALKSWLQAAGVKITTIDACCGGGGLLPLAHPLISSKITPKLAHHNIPLVSTCSGCYLQWLQSANNKVLHPLELL